MAGNSERIDDIVNRPAVEKQVNDTINNLIELEIQLADTAKGAALLNTELAKAQTFRQYQQSATKAASETAKLEAETVKLAAANQRLQQEIAKTAQQQSRATTASNQAQVSNARTSQTLTTIGQRAAATTGEYAKLLAAYNAATLAARNAGAQFGTQSTQFVEAGARVRVLRGELDAIDQPLGNFQRNVGNYANGIVRFGQRAFGAIRLVANILPGLGLSGAFLLIFEGLQFAIEKLGIFSAKAKYELTDVQKYAKEAADSVAGDFAKLNILYEASQNANLPLSERLAVVKELQKEYPAYFGNLSKEAILAGEAASAYNNLTNALIQKAVISAGQKNLEEALKPLIELRTELNRQQAVIDKENADRQAKNPSKQTSFDLTDQDGNKIPGIRDVVSSGSVNKTRQGDFIVDKNGDLKSLTQYQKEITDKVKEVNAGIQVALQDFGINGLLDPDKEKKTKPKKIADTRKQILDQQLKDAKLTQDAVLDSDKSSFEERILAVADYENKVSTLLDKARKAKVITALEESNYFKELDKTTNAERIKIADTAQKELVKIFQNGIKGQETELAQDIIDFKDNQDSKLLELERYKSEALSATADLYTDGKLTTAQYNQQVYDIENQNAKDRIDLQIETYKNIIELQKSFFAFGIGSAKEIQRAQDQLTKLEIDRSNLSTKVQLENIEKVKQAKKAIGDLEKQLADQSIELIQTLVDGGYQRQLDSLKAQEDAINKNADTEKDAIDRSLLSNNQKADAKAIIDAKTEATQEKLANQEKRIRREQAIFDKAVSIAKIIENTAIAEVQALSYLSNPFTAPLYPAIAALIAGLGAVSLATVVAQPLPQFAAGGEVGKDGQIITGELGTELRIDPDGKTSLTKDFANVSYARKGTKIVPHMELMGMLKAQDIKYTGGQVVDMTGVIKAIKDNKPQQSKQPVLNGWGREIRGMEKYNNYSKKHFN